MGRHLKQGLDFFPMDVDFFDDEKLLFVTARFGIKAEAILIRLLCRIYRSGYFLKYDNDFALLLARSVGDVSLHGLVNDVVYESLKRGFFHEDIFKKFGILTSAGIQKRYVKICTDAKRKDWSILPDFDLLRSKQTKTPEEIKKTPEESTQRKGKESKGNIDDVDSTRKSAPPSPPSPPRRHSDLPPIDPYLSLEENKNRCLTDLSVNGFVSTMTSAGMQPEHLSGWLEAFNRQLIYEDTRLKTHKDYRKHFREWIKFQNGGRSNPDQYNPIKSTTTAPKPGSLTSGIKNL